VRPQLQRARLQAAQPVKLRRPPVQHIAPCTVPTSRVVQPLLVAEEVRVLVHQQAGYEAQHQPQRDVCRDKRRGGHTEPTAVCPTLAGHSQSTSHVTWARAPLSMCTYTGSYGFNRSVACRPGSAVNMAVVSCSTPAARRVKMPDGSNTQESRPAATYQSEVLRTTSSTAAVT
jgi:hypothetical protein